MDRRSDGRDRDAEIEEELRPLRRGSTETLLLRRIGEEIADGSAEGIRVALHVDPGVAVDKGVEVSLDPGRDDRLSRWFGIRLRPLCQQAVQQ